MRCRHSDTTCPGDPCLRGTGPRSPVLVHRAVQNPPGSEPACGSIITEEFPMQHPIINGLLVAAACLWGQAWMPLRAQGPAAPEQSSTAGAVAAGCQLRASGDRGCRCRRWPHLREFPALDGGFTGLGCGGHPRRRDPSIPERAVEQLAQRKEEPDGCAGSLGQRAKRFHRRPRQSVGARSGGSGGRARGAGRPKAGQNRPRPQRCCPDHPFR